MLRGLLQTRTQCIATKNVVDRRMLNLGVRRISQSFRVAGRRTDVHKKTLGRKGVQDQMQIYRIES